MTHTELAALAIMLRRDPSELPERDGRTTIGGEQIELQRRVMTPLPGLSLEAYARQLGASDDWPPITGLRPVAVVEVESGTGWGRVELIRHPEAERPTIIEDM
jgi:hypothetical protein